MLLIYYLLPLSLNSLGFYTSPMLLWFFPCWSPEQVPVSIPAVLPVKWILPFFLCVALPLRLPHSFLTAQGFLWMAQRKSQAVGLDPWQRHTTAASAASSCRTFPSVARSLIWSALNQDVGKPASFRVSQTDCLEMKLREWKWIGNCSLHFQIWSCVISGIQKLQNSWCPVRCLSCFTWFF